MALEYKIKQGKGRQSFAKRTHWSQQTPSFNNIRDDSTHGHHQMVNIKIRLIDYIICSQIWRSSIQSAKIRPAADCGSDHELLIAKSRLKLKKVGKTTRPFIYNLNQISYDYTVEVMNRYKGLDLVDRVPEKLWMEVCNTVEDVVTKTIPKKKKCKKAKRLSEKAF